jgi:tetratricopeptide (TPR) repeat protein
MKAMLLSESGDTAKAITAWENLVTIDPKPDYVIALGTLYAFTKNPLAIAMADALLQAPKAKAEQQAIFIKGLYYSETGDKKTAIDFFDKCLQLDFTYLFAYREKAICLYDLGKYLDALKVLELSITVNKNNEEAYFWMGRCFEKLGKKEQAIQNYQLAMQLAPDYVEAKDALANLGVVQ